jgi:hypothetical protein
MSNTGVISMEKKENEPLYFNEFINLKEIPTDENYYVTWPSKILDTNYYFHISYIFDMVKTKEVFDKYIAKANEKEYFFFKRDDEKKELFLSSLTFESLYHDYPTEKDTQWYNQRCYTVRFNDSSWGIARFNSIDRVADFLRSITECIVGIDVKDIQEHIDRLTAEIRCNTEIIDDYNRILKETLNSFHYYE